MKSMRYAEFDLRDNYENRHRPESTLYKPSSSIPLDLEYIDYQWLHKVETKAYKPPWASNKAPTEKKKSSNVYLPPTVCINIPKEIPDSCPVEPLYTNVIPDSEPENVLTNTR